jgi:chromosomal replication initiator protein
MMADISLPDFETRVAILKAKAQEKGVNFSEEIYSFIANEIKNNIRELEGALNQLIAFQKFKNQNPDLEIAKKLLEKFTSKTAKIVNPKKIIQVTAEFYDLKEKELKESSRKKEVVKPRQVAMYLLREILKCSYPYIGQKFGGKDHTTVIHACEKIKKEAEKNQSLREEIELIKERILSD